MSDAADVKRHPFFGRVVWDLLLAKALPAPWLPNPKLVYAKDAIKSLSQENDAPLAEGDGAVDWSGWEYVCTQREYAENELSQFVRKSSNAAILRTVLAQKS